MTEAIKPPRVRIVCEAPGEPHDSRGRTNVKTFRQLPEAGLDGLRWRTGDIYKRPGRRASDMDRIMGTIRHDGEAVLTPGGEVLTGARRGRTRSIYAAMSGFDVDRGGSGDIQEHEDAEARAYAESLRGSRAVVPLSCRLCGRSVPVRIERLESLLDEAVARGHSRLTLAMVSNYLRR
ncbi:hypothetical protein ACH0AG_03680 [Micrococcus luteus]